MALYKFTDMTEVSNAPMSTSLLEMMRRDILTGALRPGQKIVEQDLCRKYGVSRTPIREALKQLESDGLVETILNRGAFVIGMSEKDYEDMFELRKAYEIQAVKWAIERITEEEMEVLEETFEFMEFYTMRNDKDKMMIINMEFHHVIYEAAKNRILQKLLTSFQSFLKYSHSATKVDRKYLQAVLEEHRAIFKAIKEKDIKEGALAMEIHINRARERRFG